MKAFLLSVLSFITVATASEVRIVYEKPREIAAVWASVSEDKSMIGHFKTFKSKNEDGQMRGTDSLLLVLPREGRPIVVSSSKEISGPSGSGPKNLFQFSNGELVNRIDCFENKDSIDLYVFQASKVSKITFNKNGSVNSKLVDESTVPKMKSPILMTLPANAELPVFTIK